MVQQKSGAVAVAASDAEAAAESESAAEAASAAVEAVLEEDKPALIELEKLFGAT